MWLDMITDWSDISADWRLNDRATFGKWLVRKARPATYTQIQNRVFHTNTSLLTCLLSHQSVTALISPNKLRQNNSQKKVFMMTMNCCPTNFVDLTLTTALQPFDPGQPGCTGALTKDRLTGTTTRFLWARCPSCRSTYNVKALQEKPVVWSPLVLVLSAPHV